MSVSNTSNQAGNGKKPDPFRDLYIFALAGYQKRPDLKLLTLYLWQGHGVDDNAPVAGGVHDIQPAPQPIPGKNVGKAPVVPQTLASQEFIRNYHTIPEWNIQVWANLSDTEATRVFPNLSLEEAHAAYAQLHLSVRFAVTRDKALHNPDEAIRIKMPFLAVELLEIICSKGQKYVECIRLALTKEYERRIADAARKGE